MLIMIIMYVMIVMNIMMTVLFSSHYGRWFRNDFRCRVFYLEWLVSHFIEVYFPPTQFFRKKLFLKKASSLGDKRFALRLVVEGVSNGFPWISHKDALIRLWLEFVRLEFPNISLTTQNLQVRQLWFLAKPFLIWSCLYGFGWCPIKNVSGSF